MLSCTAHTDPQTRQTAGVSAVSYSCATRGIRPTQGRFERLLRVNQNGFTFIPFPLNSESNLIHFPGGFLSKSKVFSYALTCYDRTGARKPSGSEEIVCGRDHTGSVF